MVASGSQAPLNLCLRLFGSRWRPRWGLLILILAVAGVQGLAVAGTSWLYNAWHLKNGKGFADHYGAWAILIGDPLLLVAGGALYRQFRVTMTALPTAPGRRHEFERLWRPWIARLQGNGQYSIVYLLFVTVGFAGWVVNVIQTIDPVKTYQHDVFDSFAHPASFVAFKFALFLSWVIVYPTVGYLFFYTILATWVILNTSTQLSALQPYVEHPDSCYGFRCVGNLNLAILTPFFIAIFTMIAIFETHRAYYASIIFPAIFFISLFIFISYAVIWPAQSILCRARASTFREVAAAAKRRPPSTSADSYGLLVMRYHYKVSEPSPYSPSAKAAVFAIRLAPVITFGWRLFA